MGDIAINRNRRASMEEVRKLPPQHAIIDKYLGGENDGYRAKIEKHKKHIAELEAGLTPPTPPSAKKGKKGKKDPPLSVFRLSQKEKEHETPPPAHTTPKKTNQKRRASVSYESLGEHESVSSGKTQGTPGFVEEQVKDIDDKGHHSDWNTLLTGIRGNKQVRLLNADDKEALQTIARMNLIDMTEKMTVSQLKKAVLAKQKSASNEIRRASVPRLTRKTKGKTLESMDDFTTI